MTPLMKGDPALDFLLDFDGSILEQEYGYRIKIEARVVDVSDAIPHGIRYSLTLHDLYGKRVLGYDNAHAVKPPKKYKHPGLNAMKPIVIGVMSPERIRERVLAIVSGSYRPEPDEPKIWFASMKSLAEVLSDDNRELLRIIASTQPDSISALAQTTGQNASILRRRLKTMSNYGIVELHRGRRQLRPVAKGVEFRIVAP